MGIMFKYLLWLLYIFMRGLDRLEHKHLILLLSYLHHFQRLLYQLDVTFARIQVHFILTAIFLFKKDFHGGSVERRTYSGFTNVQRNRKG